MWKKIRITLLLMILLIVGVNTYRDQNQDWTKPIIVVVHPINADGSVKAQQYISRLSVQDLDDAQEYLKQQAKLYTAQPIHLYFRLGRELKEHPPKVPENGSMLDSMLWSLKFRYYAWKQHESVDGSSSVTLYLNYYDPEHHSVLKHSTALEKGRIGTVNLFASQKYSQTNKVVLVHELLHAFGAHDKYDLVTGQPIYPDGYAYPEKNPLFPQAKAELMGGYVPTSKNTSKIPESLKQTIIRETTAKEIGWSK